MHGIVININPVIVNFMGFEIRWYSLAILIGIIAAGAIATFEGKRRGISPDAILSLLPWLLVGGMAGARLFHVLDQWSYYSTHLTQIFLVQQGGLAIWGALVGGGIAAGIYARICHISLMKLVDVVVPGLLVAQIIGRFGCIVNGDAWGAAANLPWSFIYTNPEAMIPGNLLGVPTHPYPVYDQIWNLMTLSFILIFRRHVKFDGMLFLCYLSFYAVGRFVLSFVRQERIWFWNLQEAQVVAILILIAALAVYIYLSRKEKFRTASKSLVS